MPTDDDPAYARHGSLDDLRADLQPLRVCLAREVELASRLAFQDWPGLGGPLIAVSVAASSDLSVAALANELTPTYRVLSLTPRLTVPYAAQATDLARFVHGFGFEHPVLLGRAAAAAIVLFAAASFPGLARAVLLLEPTAFRAENDLFSQSLRAARPDLDALRRHAGSDVHVIDSLDPPFVRRVLEAGPAW